MDIQIVYAGFSKHRKYYFLLEFPLIYEHMNL